MSKPTQKDAEMFLKIYELMMSNRIYDATIWYILELEEMNYQEFKEKYPSNSEGFKRFLAYGMFWEALGVLADNGLLNTDMIFDAFGSPRFGKAESIVKGMRKERGSRTLWENWELIAKKASEYWKKRQPKLPEEE